MVEGRTAAGGVTGRDPHASLRQQLDRLVEPLGELDLLARGVLEAHHHGAVELLGGQRHGTVERPADGAAPGHLTLHHLRSEEHTSELQSLMRLSSAVFCLKKKKTRPT